jgi:hypothetical protein
LILTSRLLNENPADDSLLRVFIQQSKINNHPIKPGRNGPRLDDYPTQANLPAGVNRVKWPAHNRYRTFNLLP